MEKCLDSLRAQTYTNVEFLLVDDGSTDNSDKIIDRYNDPRFRVFHTENHGLAAARNFGIEKAHGDYIMFVDSDDYVSSEFCEKPYAIAKNYGADVVIFGIIEEEKAGKQIRKPTKEIPSGIIDELTAYEWGEVAAWNKIYKKELFKGIHYPEGRNSEDTATTYKVIHKAKRIYFLEDNLYYHNLCNENSITHNHSPKNKIDAFVAAKERHEALISYGYPEQKLLPLLHARAIGVLACKMPDQNKYYIQAKNIVNSIKGNPKYLSWRQRVALFLWKSIKPLFYVTCKLTGRL